MLIDLVLTVPGAHVSHGAATGDMNPLYWRPGQRSAVSIGGSRPNGNYFLLDGATNTDPTFSTQNLSASPDAVQEFQVQTGSYSADMGGAGGGQINIITRSGTANFHGTAYEFLRNGAMDAHSFNDMGMSNFLVQNNFGASVGGPIRHTGKTFFFLNYEGLTNVETMAMVDTVPTAEEVAGDFSQSGVNIYDPATTTTNPNFNPCLPVSKANPQYIRQQFEYNGVKNVIPPSRLTQAASIMLNKYTPLPNTMDMGSMTMMGQPTVVGAGNDANNYLDLRKQRMTNDQGTASHRPQLPQWRSCLLPLLGFRRIRLHAGGSAGIRLLSRRPRAERNAGVESRVLIAACKFGLRCNFAPVDDAHHREREQE